MSTVTRNETRPIPSDATLVWLASERAAPLFRTLDRTHAFGPLVVLLAVAPAMLATFGEDVTTEDAAWGLRALEATGSEFPAEFAPFVEEAVPGATVRPAPLWISAALMRLAGPALPVSGCLASLIGGALLLGLLWPLAKSLSGRRLAFWAVLLAAFHPTLTELLRFPAPVTFGLAASVAAFWGSLNLQGKPLRLTLVSLGTVGAVFAALMMMGRVALAVPAVIVADTAFAFLLSSREAPRSSARGAASPAELAVRRLATAVAGVALWAVVEAVGSGTLFGSGGRFGAPTPFGEEPGPDTVIGPLWGLAAVGLGRLLRVTHRRAATRSPRPVPRLVLVWLAAAAATLLWRGGLPTIGFDPAGRYALAFVAIPVLLSAAYAIEEASRRAVSGAWVLLAIALPLAVRLGTLMATVRLEGPLAWAAVAVAAAAALWLLAKAAPAAAPIPGVRRGFLMSAILVAVAVNAGDGVGVLLESRSGTEAYRRLTARLGAAEPAEAVILIADSPPLSLLFAMRASYPEAAFEVVPSWDAAAAAVGQRPGAVDSPTVVVAWGARGGSAAVTESLHGSGEPLLFAGRELLIYTTDSGETEPGDRVAEASGSRPKNPLDDLRTPHYIPPASGMTGPDYAAGTGT